MVKAIIHWQQGPTDSRFQGCSPLEVVGVPTSAESQQNSLGSQDTNFQSINQSISLSLSISALVFLFLGWLAVFFLFWVCVYV